MEHTNIQWADSTVSPTTGCDGCELHVRGKGGPCYAGALHEGRLAKAIPKLYDPVFTSVRLAPGRMAKAARWPDLRGKPRPDKPWLGTMPRMIFVSDMADALSKDVPFGYLYDEVIQVASSDAGRRHVWMWLTKLPHRMAEFADYVAENGGHWPENLWAGTSITSQKTAWRAVELLDVPAKVRFLSVEPMWGPVDLRRIVEDGIATDVLAGSWQSAVSGPQGGGGRAGSCPAIGWIVAGGESRQAGFEPHPFDVAWARDLRDRCRAAGVPFFLKQYGAVPYDSARRISIDGEGSHAIGIDLADSHGGDWEEWSEDLRVREVPKP